MIRNIFQLICLFEALSGFKIGLFALMDCLVIENGKGCSWLWVFSNCNWVFTWVSNTCLFTIGSWLVANFSMSVYCDFCIYIALVKPSLSFIQFCK